MSGEAGVAILVVGDLPAALARQQHRCAAVAGGGPDVAAAVPQEDVVERHLQSVRQAPQFSPDARKAHAHERRHGIRHGAAAPAHHAVPGVGMQQVPVNGGGAKLAQLLARFKRRAGNVD